MWLWGAGRGLRRGRRASLHWFSVGVVAIAVLLAYGFTDDRMPLQGQALLAALVVFFLPPLFVAWRHLERFRVGDSPSISTPLLLIGLGAAILCLLAAIKLFERGVNLVDLWRFGISLIVAAASLIGMRRWRVCPTVELLGVWL